MTPQRTTRIEAAISRRQPDLTVVLENVFDPHNISAILRSADSVGIAEVFVIKTELPRHPKFGKRSSAGAIKWLKVWEFDSASACFEVVSGSYEQLLATHLSTEARDLYGTNLTLPTALVFGNELNGISEEALSFCNGNIVIPQMGMVQSLNVSVACAVTLYEAYRQRAAAGYYDGATRLTAMQEAHLREDWGLNP